MQKQIREQRTDDTALRRAFHSRHASSVTGLHRRPQPSFDVQQDPGCTAVLSQGSEKQFVIDVIKQAFDVELDYPVVFPASTPHQRYRIQRRTSWTVAK